MSKLLSDLIDKLICRSSECSSPDNILTLGCLMVGNPPAMGPQEFSKLDAVASRLRSRKEFLQPTEPDKSILEYYNDLFVPGFEVDGDGLLHVHFPVANAPIWSAFLTSDWSVMALTWWASKIAGFEKGKIVITVFDTQDRRLNAMADASDLTIFDKVAFFPNNKAEMPVGACYRCRKAGTCRGLATFMEMTEQMPNLKFATRELKSAALFHARTAVQARLDLLEAKKELIDKELLKLVPDGQLNFGPSAVFHLPVRQNVSWDYSKTKRILTEAQLWDDGMATVRVQRIDKLLPELPFPIRELLESEAKIVTKLEPSISEAARHAKVVNDFPIVRGCTLER